MREKTFLYGILIVLLMTRISYASGVVARRKKAKERATQQKAMQIKAAREKALKQQVMQQRRIIQQQTMLEQQRMQKAAVERAIAEKRRLQQQAAAKLAVQKLQGRKVQGKVVQNVTRSQLEIQMRNSAFQAEVAVDIPAQEKVEQVADFDDVVASLDQSSHAWPLVMDKEAKEILIDHYIQQYRQKGIVIRKPPLHYAGMVDSMSREAPEMLNQPFSQILQIMAIMEYDFDNGQSKDAMARKILGEKSYYQNLERLRQTGF